MMTQHVTISRHLVFANAISTVISRILNVAVLVWLQQYLLGHISAAEYSLYPVVMSVIVFVPLVKTVLTSGIARYAVEAKATGDEQGVTAVVSSMMPLMIGASFFFLMIGALLSWKIDDVLTVPPDRLFDAQVMTALLFGSIALRLPLIPLSTGFFIEQRLVLSNLIRILAEFLRLAILFALLFGVSTRVIWVVVAAVAADCVRAIILCAWSMRLVPALRFRFKLIDRERMRELVSFGGWRFVSQIATRIRSHADVLILNELASPAAVASYHVGSLPMRQLNTTMAEATMAMVPPLTALHATKQSRAMRDIYLRTGRYLLWLGLILVLPAIVFYREVIELYLGGRYTAAGPVMAILLLLIPIEYGHIVIARLITATAEVKSYALRSLFMQIANIGLTIFLVGYFEMGAVGSALSTLLVALILGPVLIWPLGFRMVDLDLRTWVVKTFLPGIAPGCFGLIAWIVIRLIAVPASWVELGGSAAVGMLAYLIAWIVLVSPEDKRYILSLMRRKSVAMVSKDSKTKNQSSLD